MTERMTLDEVEQRIHDTYRFFHQVDPTIRPQETGQLGQLWAMFDELVQEEA